MDAKPIDDAALELAATLRREATGDGIALPAAMALAETLARSHGVDAGRLFDAFRERYGAGFSVVLADA